MTHIIIAKKDDVYVTLHCGSGEAMELAEYFTFYVPGYKFMPAYKNKIWDGKIRLFNTLNHSLYYGLTEYVEKFCASRGYTFEYDSSFPKDTEFSVDESIKFIERLGLPFPPRDYQVRAFINAVRKRRLLLLSPTASGKSLIIYLITRFVNDRTLIIVPTVSLVSQMYKDFQDYGFDSDSNIHTITSGSSKETEKSITISTWQSIYKMPKSWFDQFELVIGDEAHLFKAKSLTTIMTSLTDCEYKFGLTGTLDGTQTNKLVLEGLFGPVKQVTTTKTLMDKGNVAEFKIKALILNHSDANKKLLNRKTYQEEMEYLISSNARNKFIKNLSISLKGNTLVLFQLVKKHGVVLNQMISDSVESGRKVFFIHGGKDAEAREEVRRITENESDAIIIASYGTFSTGVNIKNLHNVIFSSPSKSKVRTLQSIGRGLRLGDNKTHATLYDIADDITYGSKENYTLSHFKERMKMYTDEKFEYKIYNIDLKE